MVGVAIAQPLGVPGAGGAGELGIQVLIPRCRSLRREALHAHLPDNVGPGEARAEGSVAANGALQLEAAPFHAFGLEGAVHNLRQAVQKSQIAS